MCGEEDCKRCGDLNINQPCIGWYSTSCSSYVSLVHSANWVPEMSNMQEKQIVLFAILAMVFYAELV